MMRRWPAVFSAVTIGLVLIGAALLSSGFGLRLALNQLDSTLKYQSAEGNLFDARVNGLEVNAGTTTLSANQAELKWRPLSVVFGNLPITLVRLDDVVVKIRPSDTEVNEPWTGTQVPIDLTLKRFLVTNLELRAATGEPVTLDRVETTLSVQDNQLQISDLLISSSLGTAAASGKVDLNAKGVVQLEHAVELKSREGEQEIMASGAIHGIWPSLEVQQQIKLVGGQLHDASAQLKGSVTGVLSRQPRGEFTGGWDLPIAVAGEDATSHRLNNSGSFGVSGGINEYQLQIDAKTTSEDEILVTALANGRGNLSGIEFSNLEVFDSESRRMLGGKAQMDWQSNLQTELDLRLTDFQPAQFFPGVLDQLTDLNASLTGSLQANAAAEGPFGGSGELSIQKLSASWHGAEVSGQANLSVTPSELRLAETKLRVADSEMSVNGRANSESVDFAWQLASPQLSKLTTKLAGAVNGRGQIIGSLDSPRLVADLSGSSLSVFHQGQVSWQVDELNLRMDASPKDPRASFDAALNLNNFTQGVNPLIDSATLNLRGSQRQHSLTGTAKLSNDVNIELGLEGGFSKLIPDDITAFNWNGELKTAEVSLQRDAVWSLSKEARISVNANDVELSKACWNNRDQGLCLQGKGSSKDFTFDAAIDMRNIDMSRPVEIATQGKTQLSGRLEGSVRALASGASQPVRITAEVNGQDWKLKLPDLIDEDEATGAARFLTFKTAKFTARSEEAFKAQLLLQVDEDHFLSGNLSSQNPSSLAEIRQMPLQGELQFAWQDMSTLPTDLIGDVALNGQLQSRIEIAGSVNQPRIEINAEVSNARAQIAAAGLNLSDIQLQAKSNQTGQIKLQGSLLSGEGTLNLEGGLDLGNIQSPKAELRLQGTDLLLLQTADINAQGSLDLTTKLENEIVDVSGQVVLSEADLRIGPTENVVSASPDVVLLGEAEPQRAVKQRLNLQLDIGEKTKLSAAGLDAELRGQLNIRQQPGQIITGVGQISVENGVYNAYGQTLNVDEGRLIFSETSIDDPQLALQASRESSGLLVGVRVRGRAQQPSLELYSSPAMSDQDILSTLIFGKPVSGLSADDSLTLLRIASTVRSGKPDQFTRLTNSLQETLGLSDLEFRLLGDKPEVIAGKQLTSRFYVGYGYGLLDAAQSLVLRYKINKAWSIQGDFGANSGADLRYQLER